MGWVQQLSDKERNDYYSLRYKRNLEANKGHNYAYWNEKYDKLIEDNVYEIYMFPNRKKELVNYSTFSEDIAKEVVLKLRSEGNFARIVCGYESNRQRTKTFTVIYRKKKTK